MLRVELRVRRRRIRKLMCFENFWIFRSFERKFWTRRNSFFISKYFFLRIKNFEIPFQNQSSKIGLSKQNSKLKLFIIFELELKYSLRILTPIPRTFAAGLDISTIFLRFSGLTQFILSLLFMALYI